MLNFSVKNKNKKASHFYFIHYCLIDNYKNRMYGFDDVALFSELRGTVWFRLSGGEAYHARLPRRLEASLKGHFGAHTCDGP